MPPQESSSFCPEEMEMLTRIADRLGVLGHPVRLMIVGFLKSVQEASVSEIAGKLQISLPSISQHLKIMERVHLLQHRRQGRQNCYSSRMQMAAEICDAICHQLEKETQRKQSEYEAFQRLKARLQG